MNKKRSIVLKTILLSTTFLCCLMLVACSKPRESGFVYGISGVRGSCGSGGGNFLCGAKSSTNDFEIDDVTIDFYYGWELVPDYSNLCVALYFYDMDKTIWEDYLSGVEDYKTIEGCYFIKELSLEEFFTDKYKAEYLNGPLNFAGFTDFNYHEPITVPAELFSETSGTIYFGLSYIIQDKEANLYKFDLNLALGDRADVPLVYTKTGATVRIGGHYA